MTRGMALGLTMLTGFSGLVYEVTWEKYLATLLGSHSEATSAVLAIFLGGLSLGYSLFGRVTRHWVASGRGARLLVLYGVVEGSIGAYVLLFPTLFKGVLGISAALPHDVAGIGFALDVMLAALLIGPPAVLMGGTIPILTQALSRSSADATRFHALVYALNTAGAFVGALAAGFLLIPRLGLPSVMMWMGLINLSAGLSFGLLGLRRDSTPPLDAPGDAPELKAFWISATVALLVGFAMMSLQTVLIRIGGLSLGASQFTFSMVVATFVLCIALGSFAVSALPRIPRGALAVNQWMLVGLLFALYLMIPQAPYAAHVLRSLFRDVDQTFYLYYFAVFLSILIFVGPVVILSGATLPLLFDHLRRHVADLGAVAGRLYSWNTFGSLLGALLGGYALLFWLDLDQVYRVALVALVGAAALLGVSLGGRSRQVSWVLLAVSLLSVFAVGGWDPHFFVHGLFRNRQPSALSYSGAAAYLRAEGNANIVFYQDDPVSSVAVTEERAANGTLSRNIINNGKSDGNTSTDYTTMSMLALLPAMLADRVERAFVIGFGTGITVGELLVLPTIEKVVVAEISPAVTQAAPLFDFANQNVSQNPKLEMIRSDAYRALLGRDDQYDVIVSEPSNPWVQGVEMLFSREFLTAARDRLAPGGVYAQWIHQYETDSEVVELVMRTYADVFGSVAVWFGLGPDLIILGFQQDAHPLDLPRLRARAEGPVYAPALKRSRIDSFSSLLGHELLPLGVLHAAELRGRIHTLYEPILGYTAARAFYLGGNASIPFTGFGKAAALGRQNSLLAKELARLSHEEIFRALCVDRHRECVALLARWYRAAPTAPATTEYIRRAARLSPVFGGPVTLQDVRRVSQLFQVRGVESSEHPVSITAAHQATVLYAQYYTHAIPFSPAALLDIWQRCKARPGQSKACERGLAFARGMLRYGPPVLD